MIVCDIKDAQRLRCLSPLMAEAIDWLQSYRAEDFEKGSVAAGASGIIRINSEEPHLRAPEAAELEAHRRYIDIHVPLKSSETIGWASLSGLKCPHGEYDGERDICFYGDSATIMLHVRVGQMAVFFPEDAHAPNIGIGTHRKLCIKIPVE